MRFSMSCNISQCWRANTVFSAAAGFIVLLYVIAPVTAQGRRDFEGRGPPEARGESSRSPRRESDGEGSRPFPREFGGDGPPGFRGGEFPRETTATVNKGYVFIDGEYLAPPYE